MDTAGVHKKSAADRLQDDLDRVVAAIAKTDRLLALPEVKSGSGRATRLRQKRARQIRSRNELQAKLRRR